jgi:hypothetical protein
MQNTLKNSTNYTIFRANFCTLLMLKFSAKEKPMKIFATRYAFIVAVLTVCVGISAQAQQKLSAHWE